MIGYSSHSAGCTLTQSIPSAPAVCNHRSSYRQTHLKRYVGFTFSCRLPIDNIRFGQPETPMYLRPFLSHRKKIHPYERKRLMRLAKNQAHQPFRSYVITQNYRFFISADYLLPDMELQQKEQLQTQDQHEHADHQKRYVHQKQKAHPAYLLPQGKTPHQYGHSIFAGF